MSENSLLLIPILAVLIVAVVLFTGIIGFAKGGEFNRKNGNKLMRWRLIAQAIALVIMMGFLWVAGS